MGIVVAAFATLALALSPLPSWILAPVSGNVGGSYRWAAVAMAGLVALALWTRRPGVVALGGLAWLVVCELALVYLAVFDPLFWRLVDELEDYGQIMSFSVTYIPGNFGLEPGFDATVVTDTVGDRLWASLDFMGRGWWLAVLASVLLLLVGAWLGGSRRRMLAVVAVVALLGPGALLLAPSWGQWVAERAEHDFLAGRFAEALNGYERAQHLDRQRAGSEPFHVRRGEAHYRLGRTEDPHARFFMGMVLLGQGDSEGALARFRLVTQGADPALKNVLDRRLASTYARVGIEAYQKGLKGWAAGEWQRAIETRPDDLRARYYLSRVYFDQARYHDSIAASRRLLDRSKSQLLNAQIQANLGDAYWRLHDVSKARLAYAESMKLDTVSNYRVLKSLGGT